MRATEHTPVLPFSIFFPRLRPTGRMGPVFEQMSATKQILDATALRLVVSRIAHEIEENISGAPAIVIGIQHGGVGAAARIAEELTKLRSEKVESGSIDTGMHRDDLAQRGAAPLFPTDIPEDLDGMLVILVDDVVSSGRTVRAALDALSSFGRPEKVQLAVIFDRGGRELPIQPDYRGREIDVDATEKVKVKWVEEDGEDGVYVISE